jgi:endonuclease YncB( thermonuclease family)
LQGRVIAVADGDTLIVLDSSNIQYHVRLAGIDAPEKHQPFGEASKRSLSNLVFSKNVTVEWNKRDRYDRIIGKIIKDNVDIDLEQIKVGLAWWYQAYSKDQTPDDQARYEKAEHAARNTGAGLWVDHNPTSPWSWRRSHRNGR